MAEGGTKVIVIKKKGKGHGHHGGAWKVAYADFVTAMMALFIVLWLLTQSDQASKETIAEYFRTGTQPGGSLTIGKPAGSNPPVAVDILPQGSSGVTNKRHFEALAKSVGKILARARGQDPTIKKIARNVRVSFSDKGALIEIVDSGEDLLFAVSSSELKPGTILFLQTLAPVLAEAGAVLEIHGHTDGRPFGSNKKTNWDLSFERADQARRVLEAAGVKHGNINGVLAHADTQLYVQDDPFAPQNRRLSILVTHTAGVTLPKPGDSAEPSEEPKDTEGKREQLEPKDGGEEPKDEVEVKKDVILEPGSLKREAERQKGKSETRRSRRER